MRRTDRLFDLILLLRNGRLWRGQDLADELEVSLRTVYRDIDTLAASGVPIEGERGVGYVLREPIFLPPLMLTPRELEALQLGMRMISGLGDPDLVGAAKTLTSKIDAVLPSDQSVHSYAEAIGLYGARPGETHAHLPLLRHAVHKSIRLRFTYQRLDGAKSERSVRPLHLEYWGRKWTLTAWCETREDFRVFRVDRIIDALLCEEFAEDPGKTYADFIGRMTGET